MTITDHAHSLIPGYNDRQKILATLGIKTIPRTSNLVVTPTITEPAARAQVYAEIEALLLAGKNVPNDIATPIVKAQQHDALAIARASVLDAVARDHYAKTAEIYEEDITEALAYLSTELTTFIAEALPHAKKLEHITGAEDVIASAPDVAEAWRKLTELSNTYTEIRTVQHELIKLVDTEYTDAKYTHTALFADALDIDPYWTDRRDAAALNIRATASQLTSYRDWLTTHNNTPGVYRNTPTPLQLTRLLLNTRPWVPTFEQYNAAHAAAQYAVTPSTINTVDQHEEARALYYSTTDAEPLADISITNPDGQRIGSLEVMPGQRPKARRSVAQMAEERTGGVEPASHYSVIGPRPIGGY